MRNSGYFLVIIIITFSIIITTCWNPSNFACYKCALCLEGDIGELRACVILDENSTRTTTHSDMEDDSDSTTASSPDVATESGSGASGSENEDELFHCTKVTGSGITVRGCARGKGRDECKMLGGVLFCSCTTEGCNAAGSSSGNTFLAIVIVTCLLVM